MQSLSHKQQNDANYTFLYLHCYVLMYESTQGSEYQQYNIQLAYDW